MICVATVLLVENVEDQEMDTAKLLHDAGFPMNFAEKHALLQFDKVGFGRFVDLADALTGRSGGEKVRRRYWSAIMDVAASFPAGRWLQSDPDNGGDAGCIAFESSIEAVEFAHELHAKMASLNGVRTSKELQNEVRVGIGIADITTDLSYCSYRRDVARAQTAAKPSCTLVLKPVVNEVPRELHGWFDLDKPVTILDKTGFELTAYNCVKGSLSQASDALWKYNAALERGLEDLASEQYKRYLFEKDRFH